jgi:hypothetical protein
MFQAMTKLQARTVQVVSDLKKGDATISRSNVFTDWAKESCAQISTQVADEKLVWVAKGSQPQDDLLAEMSQVSDGGLKFKLFGLLDEYFEMSDQIYGDFTESLSDFKAQQLMLSQKQQNKTAEFDKKSFTFLKISPESEQKPLSTSFSEKNSHMQSQFEQVISDLEYNLKNCEDINKNLAVSFERQLKQAIQDQFAGGKAKVEEKKESPSKLCTFKSIRLSEKNNKNMLSD